MPKGLYIHIPFCLRKCNYCDFYLVTNLNIIDKFISYLCNEIEIIAGKFNESYDTIFMGGGTPSLLTEIQLEKIINTLHKCLSINKEIEFTIECNPENLTENNSKTKFLKDSGVNRLSLGVQSFNDNELKVLTREHNSIQAIASIETAKKYFDNISIDIIYSLPLQEFGKIEKTVNTAVSLGIPHISAYTLIYEDNTPLNKLVLKNQIKRNEDTYEEELYLKLSELLRSKGYGHYEISNYALKGYESKHNLKYWNYEEYIGVGPSAHSFYNLTRWNNFSNIISYNLSLKDNKLPYENIQKLNIKEQEMEFIMLALRSKGIEYEKYEHLFNEIFKEKYKNQIEELANNSHAVIGESRFVLTEKGYALLDEICAKYF